MVTTCLASTSSALLSADGAVAMTNTAYNIDIVNEYVDDTPIYVGKIWQLSQINAMCVIILTYLFKCKI